MSNHQSPPVIHLPLIVLAVLLVGCSSNTQSASQTASEGAVAIISGEEPSEEAKTRMLAAKDDLFTKLSGRLMEEMAGQGPAASISVCQTEAPQIAAEVSEEHGLRIGRTGVRLRNSNNQPPTWAKTLTDNKTDTPTFVVLDNDDAAALLPIKLQGQCLMCHGPKDQIPPVVQDQLASLYPEDEATGFKEGDLRGWFWIEIPKD